MWFRKRTAMKRGIELHPTGLHPACLSAQVLDFMHRSRLGLLGLAAAADVVAAECRFNYWAATEVKKAGLGEDWWLRFLEAGEAHNEKCRAAMGAFSAGGALETLCHELKEVAAFYNKRSFDDV
jgi:hypothetical protein